MRNYMVILAFYIIFAILTIWSLPESHKIGTRRLRKPIIIRGGQDQ